ncbi:hypothetical protein ACP70R_045061 [Stipagrostis hirtigluma subsp. patula]
MALLGTTKSSPLWMALLVTTKSSPFCSSIIRNAELQRKQRYAD